MFPEISKNFPIDNYTILLMLGVFAFIYYSIFMLEKRYKYDRGRVNKILIFVAIALVIMYLGSLLFDAFFHYLEDGHFKLDSITFLGGIIPGMAVFIISMYYFNKNERGNILNIVNIIIPGVILAHAIGRIGCFLAGCCYGIETNSFLGIKFPGLENKVLPTQLFESFFLFGLFGFLHFFKKIKDYKFIIYLFSYGLFRFLIEFLRGDDRGKLFSWISPSQGLSIVLWLWGIGLIVYLYKKKKLEASL